MAGRNTLDVEILGSIPSLGIADRQLDGSSSVLIKRWLCVRVAPDPSPLRSSSVNRNERRERQANQNRVVPSDLLPG